MTDLTDYAKREADRRAATLWTESWVHGSVSYDANSARRSLAERDYREGILHLAGQLQREDVIEAGGEAWPEAYQRAVQQAPKGPAGISRAEARKCYIAAFDASVAAMLAKIAEG